MEIAQNWIGLVASQIAQMANGIIRLVGDFRLTVKKEKAPIRGLFRVFGFKTTSIRNRNGYRWTVGKADNSQCGFFGFVAAKEEAFAGSGAP